MREYRTIDDYWWFVKGSSIIDKTNKAFCVFQGNTFNNHSGRCAVSVNGTGKVGKYIRVHDTFYIVTEEPSYYK